MQKRGVLLLEVLVKLVPVIIILLLFLSFVFVFLPSILGETKQQDKNSFQSVGKVIDNMLSKNTAFESYELTLTMPSANIIKGYDTTEPKPTDCGEDACVCVYYKSENVDKKKPDDCHVFNNLDFYKSVEFYTLPRNPQVSARQNKSNPSYPSPLDSWGYSALSFHTYSLNNRPQINTVYFEKYVHEGKAYILMSPVVDGTYVLEGKGISREQMSIRAESLKPCPSESDPDCIGVTINSRSTKGLCQYEDSKCTLLKVENCVLDEASTVDCICGTKLMNKGDASSPAVCTKDREGNYKTLQFSCTKVTSCRSYCDAETANQFCESKTEVDMCPVDPCKIGRCAIYAQNMCGAVANY